MCEEMCVIPQMKEVCVMLLMWPLKVQSGFPEALASRSHSVFYVLQSI